MLTKTQRHHLRRSMKRITAHHVDRLAQRARLRDLLAQRANPKGNVFIEVYSRDCDLTETTELFAIPAQVTAYRRVERDVFEGAEGPCSLHVLTPEEVRGWRPYLRDRAAEMAGY